VRRAVVVGPPGPGGKRSAALTHVAGRQHTHIGSVASHDPRQMRTSNERRVALELMLGVAPTMRVSMDWHDDEGPKSKELTLNVF
jgi:hypothetical protein